VLVITTKDIAIRVTSSIESSKALWLKVVISLDRMVQVVRVFMVKSSKMKVFGIHIHTVVYFLWLMLDQIPMDLNSSSALDQHHT